MLTLLRSRIQGRQHDGHLDAADVVQTVILIAGFVIVTIIIVLWMSTAILNQGVDAGRCVEGAQSTYAGGENHKAACTGGTYAQGNNSFTKSSEYTNRY